MNPQTCQGSFPSCCSMGWKEEFIPRVRKMFLTLVVPIASLSPPNPPEMAGHHPHPQPPTNSAGLLSLVILHLSSLSQILFLIFLSLYHSLYHRFLSYLLLLPLTPLSLSLRTFANPFPHSEPTFFLFPTSYPSIVLSLKASDVSCP